MMLLYSVTSQSTDYVKLIFVEIFEVCQKGELCLLNIGLWVVQIDNTGTLKIEASLRMLRSSFENKIR